ATLDTHRRQPIGDHRGGVAQHCTSQRDFQRNQDGREPMLLQCGEDGLDLHGRCSVIDLPFVGASLLTAGRRQAGSQSVFNCNAGAIRLARSAGSAPASRLTATASTKVTKNMDTSMCTRSEYGGCWRRTSHSPTRVKTQPPTPPMKPTRPASVRHCANTARREAPSARRTPISPARRKNFANNNPTVLNRQIARNANASQVCSFTSRGSTWL